MQGKNHSHFTAPSLPCTASGYLSISAKLAILGRRIPNFFGFDHLASVHEGKGEIILEKLNILGDLICSKAIMSLTLLSDPLRLDSPSEPCSRLPPDLHFQRKFIVAVSFTASIVPANTTSPAYSCLYPITEILLYCLIPGLWCAYYDLF